MKRRKRRNDHPLRAGTTIIPRADWPAPRWRNGHWTYYFFEQTYREPIYVLWPCTPDLLKAFIDGMFPRKTREYVPSSDMWWARHVDVQPDNAGEWAGQVIAFREWRGHHADIGSLAHESLHCALAILSVRGVPAPTSSADEPLAYLLDQIVSRIHRAMSMVPR